MGGCGIYSGEGSHDDQYVLPYVDMIKDFIDKNQIISVVDLGCGDFNVASKWLNNEIGYIGIDIVDAVIDNDNKLYGTSKVKFQKLDIVEDDLPKADLCLVRQVFQHLCNDDILKIVKKFSNYKYIIVTEHRTKKKLAQKYNIDIHTGASSRAGIGRSGIYLDEPPFSLDGKEVLCIPYDDEDCSQEIVSFLITNKYL